MLTAEDGGAPRSESPVERIERAIRRHLTDPDLDVERVAREANTSRSHLKRLLADAGLPPPSVLIRERRLDEAARLLARGRGTVTEVAYATGFQALSNFARRFRERFGETCARRVDHTVDDAIPGARPEIIVAAVGVSIGRATFRRGDGRLRRTLGVGLLSRHRENQQQAGGEEEPIHALGGEWWWSWLP